LPARGGALGWGAELGALRGDCALGGIPGRPGT
jgi:hypothetical protein